MRKKQISAKKIETLAEMLKDSLAKKIAGMGYGFKRSVLSRESGVTEEAISQIITGATKNPGVYTIAKMADVLNCSIDELIGRKTSQSAPKSTIEVSDKIALKPELAKNCVITIMNLLDQKQQIVTFSKFLYIVNEIYTYCLSKNLETVDTEFANGFVEHATRK